MARKGKHDNGGIVVNSPVVTTVQSKLILQQNFFKESDCNCPLATLIGPVLNIN